MQLLTWGDEFNFGISLIDRQHKTLFDLLNQVNSGLLKQADIADIGSALSELISSVDIHFRTEERLMHAHSYPGYEMHKSEHQGITKKIQEFQKAVQAGKASLTTDMMHVFKKLLEQHILGIDKQYREFFLSKGVQ